MAKCKKNCIVWLLVEYEDGCFLKSENKGASCQDIFKEVLKQGMKVNDSNNP